MKSILIVTAVEKEREAVRRVFAESEAAVELCGFGPAESAARTMKAALTHKPDVIINAGIAGAFPGRAVIGDVIVGTHSIFADLGAESEAGFLSTDELGFGTSAFSSEAASQFAELQAHYLPILTVSTAAGTESRVSELMVRYPEAGGEAMEGAGAAHAALICGIPFVEIRAVSNITGPRSLQKWDIEQALKQLSLVLQQWKERVE
ncbi:futalosine hydrolase [Bacillus daqingensis]|uniref:Futalosine hydrolase n=1 Tax=Bacillus daqingensis TaxID=872396 RepID=A0ABV9NRT0_9BACI